VILNLLSLVNATKETSSTESSGSMIAGVIIGVVALIVGVVLVVGAVYLLWFRKKLRSRYYMYIVIEENAIAILLKPGSLKDMYHMDGKL